MRNKSGFTLVELLMVIALITVVAAIAVPNIISWLPDYRLKAAANDLFSNFQKAKLTAVKRNTNCVVIVNSTGYTVFMDDDTDFVQDGGEDVIVQITWADYKSVSVNLGNITFDNSTGQPTIGFRPNGIPVDNGGGIANGTAQIDNTNGKSRSVIISQAGSIRAQ
jgi:type IV fimbrial biogenesis protein FimT